MGERPVAGFNLVAVIGGEGLCMHYDGTLRPVPFGPGLHVVSSNRDLDDPSMEERKVFEELAAGPPPDDRRLTDLLASHDGPRPVCKHGDTFGTVSSMIYQRDGRSARLLHAPGPPCRAEFNDYSSLLG